MQSSSGRDLARLVAALFTLFGTVNFVTPLARAAAGGPDAGGTTWHDADAACPVSSDALVPRGSSSFPTAVVGPLALGFTFPFYDITTTQVWVSRSGQVFFADPGGVSSPDNLPIPTVDGQGAFLAAYWDLLADSAMTYGPVGDGRTFRIEFAATTVMDPGRVHAQIDLRWDGDIHVDYLDLPATSTSATIGVESPDESTGLQIELDGVGTNGFVLPGTLPHPLCIDRPPSLDCDAAVPLTCGTSTGFSPSTLVSPVQSYGCGARAWSGHEAVYRIERDDVSDLSVTLTPEPGHDMAVFLLDACDEARCLDGGDLTAGASNLPPGTYYVVVDPADPSQDGAFQLDLACTSRSEPIACGDAPNVTTSSDPSRLDSYSCVGGTFPGGESHHVLDVTTPSQITVTFASAANAAVIVYGPGERLTPSTCLTGGLGGTAVFNAGIGRHVIVVDSDQPVASGVLSVECGTHLSCGTAIPLSCNESITESNEGVSGFARFYSCRSWPLPAPELLFSFDNPVQQVVSFSLDDTLDPGLDLYLMAACDESQCIALDDNLITRDLPPGTYYLAVDGPAGPTGEVTISAICSAGLDPPEIDAVSAPGGCFDAHDNGWVTPEIHAADVLLAIDLTGSMAEERAELQVQMSEIVRRLSLFIPDVAFGVASFKDYTVAGCMSPCPYSNMYGAAPDYPYQLEHAMTTDEAAIQSSLDALPFATGGADLPESYSRVLHEAVNDPAIAWRPGTRRIVVMFGDSLPHDCNVLSCLGGFASEPRGIDAGRDGLSDTGDELSLQGVIDGLLDARMVLLYLDSSGGDAMIGGTPDPPGVHTHEEVWDCWSHLTGGDAIALNRDGTVPSGIDLSEAIADLVEGTAQRCTRLELVTEPGYEDWLVSATPVYEDVELPTLRDFDLHFCVPPGTSYGTHVFEVRLLCSGEVVASQVVSVDVVADCRGAIANGPEPRAACNGSSTTLDATGMTLVNCAGLVQYEWRDGAGTLSTDPVVTVAPGATTTYSVTLTCSDAPTCSTTHDVTVTIDEPPTLALASVADALPCSRGMDVSWTPATFPGASGAGTYSVYRSELSCADALTRRPLVTGLTGTTWRDDSTRDGHAYFYVVEAESAERALACRPTGPKNAGAVARACVSAPVTEIADATPPAGANALLRASHAGDDVTLSWTGARTLASGEHFHLGKAVGRANATYVQVNPEGDIGFDHVDRDTTSPLQFFLLRVANACEIASTD